MDASMNKLQPRLIGLVHAYKFIKSGGLFNADSSQTTFHTCNKMVVGSGLGSKTIRNTISILFRNVPDSKWWLLSNVLVCVDKTSETVTN